MRCACHILTVSSFKPGDELTLESMRLSTEFVEKTLPTLLASVVYYYPSLQDEDLSRMSWVPSIMVHRADVEVCCSRGWGGE